MVIDPLPLRVMLERDICRDSRAMFSIIFEPVGYFATWTKKPLTRSTCTKRSRSKRCQLWCFSRLLFWVLRINIRLFDPPWKLYVSLNRKTWCFESDMAKCNFSMQWYCVKILKKYHNCLMEFEHFSHRASRKKIFVKLVQSKKCNFLRYFWTDFDAIFFACSVLISGIRIR